MVRNLGEEPAAGPEQLTAALHHLHHVGEMLEHIPGDDPVEGRRRVVGRLDRTGAQVGRADGPGARAHGLGAQVDSVGVQPRLGSEQHEQPHVAADVEHAPAGGEALAHELHFQPAHLVGAVAAPRPQRAVERAEQGRIHVRRSPLVFAMQIGLAEARARVHDVGDGVVPVVNAQVVDEKRPLAAGVAEWVAAGLQRAFPAANGHPLAGPEGRRAAERLGVVDRSGHGGPPW